MCSENQQPKLIKYVSVTKAPDGVVWVFTHEFVEDTFSMAVLFETMQLTHPEHSLLSLSIASSQ